MNFKIGDAVHLLRSPYLGGTASMYHIHKIKNGIYYGRWTIDRRQTLCLGRDEDIILVSVYNSKLYKALK